MASLVVENATIVTQDATRRIVKGSVRVEDGVITHVGDAPRTADEVLDGAGCVLAPGFVNAHTHSPMTLLRGVGDDLPLMEWLETRIWPLEGRLTADDVAAGSDLACLEMIAGGTTTFSDMYFFPDETARAVTRAGLRAWVGVPFLDFPMPGLTPADAPDFARRFFKTWATKERVTPVLAPHATYTCGPETLARIAELRADLDDGSGHARPLVHTHVAETRNEVYDVEKTHGKRPLAQLEAHGLVDDRSVLAHCGWITKDEARRIGHAGAAVAHCPVSNLKLATGGTMPLPELDDAGAVVALGTDGAASNNTLDMVESMKFAALVHKQHRWDATIAPAQRVLDLATLGGARALGAAAEIGSIEVGKRADFALFDFKKPHLTPMTDVVSHLVYAAGARDVRATVVDGQVVYVDGVHRTLDARRVMARADSAATRLREAGGAGV